MSPRAFLALAILAVVPAGSVAAAGARLLRADAQGVTFEHSTLPGAAATTPQVVWIAVPPGATVQVSSTMLAEESIAAFRGGAGAFGFDAATAPGPGGGAPERGVVRDALAARSAPDDGAHARLLGITGLRGLRVAAIEIRPAVYDPAGDRLRIATRLAVDCAFIPLPQVAIPSPAPPPSPVFAGIERALLLNAASADAFRPRISRAPPRRPTAGPLENAVEVRVAGKGVHEITGAALAAAGVSLEGFDPRWFRLFTRPGLPLLPEDSLGGAYERAEVAIRIDDGDDGHFDAEDRILFYGVGPSGWFDDFGIAGADTLDWLENPYETHNVYMLTLDPGPGDPPAARWGSREVAPTRPGALAVESVRARMHFEEERLYLPESNEPERTWDPWAWLRALGFGTPFDVALHVDGVVPARAARFRGRFWGRRNQPFDSTPLRLDLFLGSQFLATRSWLGGAPQVIDTTGAWLTEGDNRLRMIVAQPPGPTTIHEATLMACDLVFDRRLLAVGDTLEFAGPDGPGDRAYDIAPFSDGSGLVLLDVSDPLHPVELTGGIVSDATGGLGLQFHDDRPGARYFVASGTARRRPAVSRLDTRDVRTGAADYLVICSDALEGEARALAEHRRTVAPPFPGATAQVVRVGDIFRAYSGGRMDPAAIRNFLYDAVQAGGWSPAPTFVCFLGDASYDHRNVLRLEGDMGRTQVPTFQRNFYPSEQYSSDDWLVDLDVGAGAGSGAGHVPDFILGRLPAGTVTEASVLVDKIRDYDLVQANDSGPRSGDWRNRLLWLVDDASQGTQADPLGSEFTREAEELDRDHLPAWLERVKVNLLEYPLAGQQKPDARQATIDQLRRGALVWHFVGRGNPFLLADERAFRLEDVAPLDNGRRLPVFIAQTASVGEFDNPIWSAGFLGEAMLKHPNGGSVATYAATDVTFAFASQNLAKALLDALFAPDRLDARRTLGEAAFLAATRSGGSPNDRLYQLLGDPGMRLATAPWDVRLSFFDDATGAPLTDSLPRGRLVRVEAEVHRTRDSSLVALAGDFAGLAQFRVSDSPPVWSYPPEAFGPGASYVGNPRDAALAAARIVGGRGTARFIVPVAATPGPGARVQAWIEDSAGNASGARHLAIGAARPDPSDVTGPRIDVRMEGIQPPSASYLVDLIDPSGIRTLTDSSAHRVTVSIDGEPPVDVTAQVQAVPDRFDACVYAGSFRDLANGAHVLRVEASDNLAGSDDDRTHRSALEIPFRVAAVVGSFERRALTFPNPFSRVAGTTLVFTGLEGGSQDEVDILIHDIRGRRLRRLHGRGGGAGIQVPWDGRDDDGHALPPGVYPWRAVLSLDGGAAQEYTGRLVLLD